MIVLRKCLAPIFVVLALAAVGSTAVADGSQVRPALHHSLAKAELPPVIPVDTFFSMRTESWDHRVSPDGSKLLWIALHDDKPTVHFRRLNSDKVTVIKGERGIKWAYWAADSRHITAWWDFDGDENYHFLLADSEHPDNPFRDVTPHKGVKVRFQQYFPDHPLEYLLKDNRRDRALFDLYWHNIATGEERLVMENSGDVMQYHTNQSGEVIAVKRRRPDTSWVFEVPEGGGWRTIVKGTTEDAFWVSGKPPVGATWAWAVSNLGRDKQAMVRLDLKTGAETLVYEDPKADVTNLWLDEFTYKPLAARSAPDYPTVKVFDATLRPLYDRLAKDGPVQLSFRSWNRDKSVFTVRIDRDTTGRLFFLLDRKSGKLRHLASPAIAKYSRHLSPMKPVQFTARDGLTLNGYLTIPAGTDGKNLPMVLAVHGGPFSRDWWGYRAYDQFFANRGYAVLRVNYRGSTGYGRAFMQAAKKQFARSMHDDLIDGVNWAIAKGIADPKKIAIYGRSYGGYATLVGLTLTPGVFAAGVDVVGVSDLVTSLRTFPGYWKNWLGRWHRYVGRLDNPADVEDMKSRSPIHYVDRIIKPLLVVHGANDVRVVREHSDRIVAAARQKGLDVKYIVFDDEGHGITKWKNRMSLARAIEAFLAKHIGGRAEIAAQ